MLLLLQLCTLPSASENLNYQREQQHHPVHFPTFIRTENCQQGIVTNTVVVTKWMTSNIVSGAFGSGGQPSHFGIPNGYLPPISSPNDCAQVPVTTCHGHFGPVTHTVTITRNPLPVQVKTVFVTVTESLLQTQFPMTLPESSSFMRPSVVSIIGAPCRCNACSYVVQEDPCVCEVNFDCANEPFLIRK
ncbi:hypothetical protein SK128_018761 [Halocaridina rubra]|uniref:Uncharacterized protein n=1 Tax=Halocaridina rubra TaxID=373956 RepID=A0AAN8X8Z2_HALRR